MKTQKNGNWFNPTTTVLGFIAKVILFAIVVSFTSIKDTAITLWTNGKKAIAAVRAYTKATPDERKVLKANFLSDLRVWSAAGTILWVTAFMGKYLFRVSLGVLLGFMPVISGTLEILWVFWLTKAIINAEDKYLGLRADVVCAAWDLRAFAIGACVPWTFLTNFGNLIPAVIACAANDRWTEIQSKKASNAAAPQPNPDPAPVTNP